MPTFSTTKGAEVYIPWHALILLEAAPGGLETRVYLAAPMSQPQVNVVAPVMLDVQGTLDTVRRSFMAEALNMEHVRNDVGVAQ
jgi:hypothetical protein